MAKCVYLLALLVFSLAVKLGSTGNDESKSTRVIGGHLARDNEIPYIVAISGSPGKKCAGAIYTTKFIITANHCFKNVKTDDQVRAARVRAGSVVFNKGQEFSVKKVHHHPEYSPATGLHDIAILELEKKLKLGPGVAPIPLAPQGLVSSGKATFAGWGQTQTRKSDAPKGATTDKLQVIDTLVIVPRRECDAAYASIPVAELYVKVPAGGGRRGAAATTICAGVGPTGRSGTCQGDSGGPLVCSRTTPSGKPEKYLCGILNGGVGCGLAIPDAYADVPGYTDWIKKVTGT